MFDWLYHFLTQSWESCSAIPKFLAENEKTVQCIWLRIRAVVYISWENNMAMNYSWLWRGAVFVTMLWEMALLQFPMVWPMIWGIVYQYSLFSLPRAWYAVVPMVCRSITLLIIHTLCLHFLHADYANVMGVGWYKVCTKNSQSFGVILYYMYLMFWHEYNWLIFNMITAAPKGQ
jgi:hypothetical protein